MAPQDLCSRCPLCWVTTSPSTAPPRRPPRIPAFLLLWAFGEPPLISVSNMLQSFLVLSPECLALSAVVPPSPQHGYVQWNVNFTGFAACSLLRTWPRSTVGIL